MGVWSTTHSLRRKCQQNLSSRQCTGIDWGPPVLWCTTAGVVFALFALYLGSSWSTHFRKNELRDLPRRTPSRFELSLLARISVSRATKMSNRWKYYRELHRRVRDRTVAHARATYRLRTQTNPVDRAYLSSETTRREMRDLLYLCPSSKKYRCCCS